MAWKAFLLFCDMRQSSQVALYVHQNVCSSFFLLIIYTFLLIIAMQDETRGKLSTWQTIAWKAFLSFGDLCSSSHFFHVCASFLLNFSCDFWNYSSKEGSLEHCKTWLGRRFCCLVIHACPICASKWLCWCYFSPFLWMLDFKLGKST